VSEGLGLPEAVAGFPGEAESLLVALGGRGQVTEAVLRVAEAVPGGGLVVAVAELAVQGDGLPAEFPGPLVVAEQDLTPAHRVQRRRLPGPVADGPEQAESPLGVAERGMMVALALRYQAQVLVDQSLADLVAEPLVLLQA